MEEQQLSQPQLFSSESMLPLHCRLEMGGENYSPSTGVAEAKPSQILSTPIEERGGNERLTPVSVMSEPKERNQSEQHSTSKRSSRKASRKKGMRGKNNVDDSTERIEMALVVPAEEKVRGRLWRLEEIVREQKEHIEAIERKVEKNRVNFEISRLLSHMKHPDRNANDPVSLEDNLEAAGLIVPEKSAFGLTFAEEQEKDLIRLQNDRIRANGGQIVRPGGFRLPNHRQSFQLLNFVRACTLGRKLNWHKSLDFEKWECLEWNQDDCVSSLKLPHSDLEMNLSLLGSLAGHHLNTLDLAKNSQLTGSIETTIRGCKRLVHLDLNATKVIGDVQHIAKLRSLKHINIRETECRGDLDFVRHMLDLRVLILPPALRGDIDALRQHKYLQVLDLRQSHIGGDIAALEKSRQLRMVALDDTNVNGDIYSLVEHTGLEILSMRKCRRVVGDIRFIGFPKLRECYLNQTGVIGSIEVFGRCQHLRFLSLRNTSVEGPVRVLEEKCNRLELYGLGGTNATF